MLNQKGSDYMMQQKEYSPEQISDAEKLCLFLQGIKDDDRRNHVTSMAIAYISGIEYGIATERDAGGVAAKADSIAGISRKESLYGKSDGRGKQVVESGRVL